MKERFGINNMRIKFDYGKNIVPSGVICKVLELISHLFHEIHPSSMDIYLRFHDENGAHRDIGHQDESGNIREYMLVVTPEPLKKEPLNTVGHISIDANQDAHPSFEMYWTTKG